MKTFDELNRLVHEVICPSGFNIDDLQHFNAHQETACLDRALAAHEHLSHSTTPDLEASVPLLLWDGWKELVICIPIPDGKKHQARSDPPVPVFDIHGLHHCSLTKVIYAAWSETPTQMVTQTTAHQYHFIPFQQFWQRKPGVTEAVCDEVYTSEAFIKEYKAVQHLPEPDCMLERTVCTLMFWSDSTHLTMFGTTSLWPIYLAFGNESKYSRAGSKDGVLHHLAYIPKVSFHHPLLTTISCIDVLSISYLIHFMTTTYH